MATTRRVSQQKKERFLEAYAETGTLTHAAKAVGMDRRTHYDWLKSDDEYRARFEEAQDAVCDSLEGEAIRRAKDGSDTLLIFLLKGLLSDKYGQRTTVEVKDRADPAALIEQAKARRLQYIPGGLSRGA